MDRTNANANANRSIEFMYQGKPGGVKNNTSNDVLTREIVYIGTDGKKTEAHAVFERAGNKTLWQKIEPVNKIV